MHAVEAGSKSEPSCPSMGNALQLADGRLSELDSLKLATDRAVPVDHLGRRAGDTAGLQIRVENLPSLGQQSADHLLVRFGALILAAMPRIVAVPMM